MLLEVHHADFYYTKNNPILTNINFSMDHREILAVMGRNGIGKTTMVKCIAGILPWKNGYSIVDGQKSGIHQPMHQIGYVPQAHKTSFSYTVRDMVVFGRVGHRSYFASPNQEDYSLAEEALAEIGISELSNKLCNELSGGQLQLVFIARALVNMPKVLILDEPEAHLDFRNQVRLLKLIQRVVSEKNISCIINTHYPNHAIRIATKCFLLGDQDYLVGDMKQIMTESNIQKYFLVQSKVLHAEYKGKDISTFIFLDEIP